MATSQETLFSLEVVVEKLYLPYVPCRFPAVAFRLLDFPTILINHVEPELANRIKKKISIDPYYKVPNQFADLQDKHGNFLVKKGKSCLFKISVETLAMHLENTPMYIMVIDEFPEVPKLLGNSSLAMNEIVDAVKNDIRKNGMTVPSVQGDKGLFKIYSLMGKEIGYMIIGFRLLSLGPGLIAHLPATAIAKRASEIKKKEKSKTVVEEMIEVKDQKQTQSSVNKIGTRDVRVKKEALNDTKDMGSMTDVEKCDALMQTVEMLDENLHIAISEKNSTDLKTTETQTEYVLKQRKPKKAISSQKLKFSKEEGEDSDDGLVINQQLACPPPLFYNKNSEPDVHIEKDILPFRGCESNFDDATLEDLSGDEQIIETAQQFQKPKNYQDKEVERKEMQDKKVMLQDAKTVIISNIKKDENKTIPSLLGGAENGFPLLNALLMELSKIQHPQLVNTHINNVVQVPPTTRDTDRSTHDKPKQHEKGTDDAEDAEKNLSRRKQKKNVRDEQSQKGSRQKGWIRKAPDAAVKKTKLVFGLTNTQRLRLAKQNPEWLKTAEQDEKIAKAQRHKPQKLKEIDADLDTGNLSDTFTEVRRLAAAELENTTMALNTKVTKVFKQKKRRNRSRDNSQTKDKSTKRGNLSPYSKPRVDGHRTTNKRDMMDTIDSANEDNAFTDRDMQDVAQESKPESAADSAPSSRIEVHIPSARDYESDDQENTFTDSFDKSEPSPERKESRPKFPGFNSGDNLPDSIIHDGNTSINSTQLDDDSPLESTRVSKQFRTVPQTGDTVFKSTEDYDTRQFHSTDEPELQNLISDDERSESRPRPEFPRSSARSPSPAPTNNLTNSARLSMKFEVLNPTASQQSPLPAVRRSQQLKVDSFNARPTPTDTPRSRSSQSSPKQPTPRARKPIRERRLDFKKESIHTESVSSYMPSESENILSLISDGSYSDDFQMSSEKDMSSRLSTPELPKVSNKQRLIPSTKLGFTIH